MKTGSFQLLIAPFILSVTLASCGKAQNKKSEVSNKHQNEQIFLQQEDEGVYRADLLSLNSEKFGQGFGSIEVKITGDHVVVATQMSDVHSGIKHYQNIMTNKFCPDLLDDKNNDSYIDILEAMARTGQILIPLDSNISNQLKGMDYGPIANSVGKYVYRRSTSLTELLIDLNSPDPDLTDSISKLPFGMNLNLSGKAVLIHGVRESENLPESVSTINNLKPSESMPIACGILKRVQPSTQL